MVLVRRSKRPELSKDEAVVILQLVPAARENPGRRDNYPGFSYFDGPFITALDDRWIQGHGVELSVDRPIFDALVEKGYFDVRRIRRHGKETEFDLTSAAYEYADEHGQETGRATGKIRDLVPWSRDSWFGWGRGRDRPNFTTATLKGATATGEDVHFEVRDGEKSFSSKFTVQDPQLRSRVVDTLNKAKGSTLAAAGDELVD